MSSIKPLRSLWLLRPVQLLFGAFFLQFLLPCALAAQGVSPSLPAVFRRVGSVDELVEGGYYVLMGETAVGRCVLMSHSLDGNGKLEGLRLVQVDSLTVEIEVNHEDDLWLLQRDETGNFRLVNPSDGRLLTRAHEDGLGLKWTVAADDASLWNLTFNDRKQSFWRALGQTDRSLSVYSTYRAASKDYVFTFDNYALPDTPHLTLYRLADGVSTPSNPLSPPRHGSRVVLSHQQMLRLTDGRAVNAADALLTDGTFAPMADLDVWTVDSISPSHFTLRREARFLGYHLDPVEAPSVWQVADGRLCTAEAVPRYPAFDEASSSWYVASNGLPAVSAQLATVAADPSVVVSESGSCRLEGGWTVSALSELSFGSVRCLDLTALSLPRQASAFLHLPDTVNLPIFVSSASVDAVPASWPFVVVCSNSRNYLLRPYRFVDKASFYTDRSIFAEAGQLTYTRTDCVADKWYSLCLPFRATAKGAQVYASVELSADTLFFARQQELLPGRPYLFRAEYTGLVTFASASGELSPVPVDEPLVRGVFHTLRVGPSDAAVRLFSSSRQAFVPAASGSSLSPFRAYLSSPSSQVSPRVVVRGMNEPQDAKR